MENSSTLYSKITQTEFLPIVAFRRLYLSWCPEMEGFADAIQDRWTKPEIMRALLRIGSDRQMQKKQ